MMMQHLSRFFTFILALQFIWMPLPNATTTLAYAQVRECPEGMYRPNANAKCVVRKSNAEIKKEINDTCSTLEGEAYRNCLLNNAKSATDGNLDKKNQGDVDSQDRDPTQWFTNVFDNNIARVAMPAAVFLGVGTYVLTQQDRLAKCPSASIYFLLGGATLALLGEGIGQIMYSIELSDLQESYANDVAAEERRLKGKVSDHEVHTNTQKRAFQYLIQQEEARIQLAEIRKYSYYAASLLHVTALVLSITEAVRVNMGDMSELCYGPTENFDLEENIENVTDTANQAVAANAAGDGASLFGTLREQALTETGKAGVGLGIEKAAKAASESGSQVEEKEVEPKKEDPQTNEQGDNAFYLPGQDGIYVYRYDLKSIMRKIGQELSLSKSAHASLQTNGFIGKAFHHPLTRGALAAGLATYAGFAISWAYENIDISNARIKELNKIVQEFTNTGGTAVDGCTEEQRQNPGTPNCYCFTSEGKPDPAKEENPVCKYKFQNIHVDATKYGSNRGGGYRPVKACLRDNKITQDCAPCKKDPASCNAIPSAALGGISFGSTSGLNDFTKSYNGVATGQMSMADLDSAQLNRTAARMKQVFEQMSQREPHRDIIDKIKKANISAQSQIATQAAALKPRSGLMAAMGPNQLSNTPANKALEEAKKQLEQKEKESTKAMSTVQSGKSLSKQTKEEDGFGDFSFGAEHESGVEVEDSGIMNKNFAIKGDIHKNPDNNIFDILSLRYQRSGLRRLFDSEGKSEADASSGSDINPE